MIRRVLSGFADVESSAAPGLARAVQAAGRACRAAWRRVAWAAVVTVAAVVLLAGAVWLAAFVAVPGW
jgi:type VI protein secretion system component VasF